MVETGLATRTTEEGGLLEVTHYGGGWIGYTPMGPAVPRPLRPEPIATYRATLPAGTVPPTLTLAPGADRAAMVAALNRRPEYMPFSWPDHELDGDADLRTLALLKMLAIVRFSTRWPSLDPEVILAHARRLDPDLAARTRPWLLMRGEVLPNGDASFGIQDLPDGDPTPDMIGGTDDAFIRAAAGAGLIRLIRAGNASWDPFAAIAGG